MPGLEFGKIANGFGVRLNNDQHAEHRRRHQCSLTNDITLLRLVLPANPDLDRLTRFGGVGITPASEKGHVEIVRELLEKTDINVNHTNFVGWTPLLEAIVLNDGGAKQQEIVKLLLKQLEERLKERNITLEVTPEALNIAAKNGYDPVYGARPLKRYLQKRLETQIARLIISGEAEEGSVIRVENQGNDLVIHVE